MTQQTPVATDYGEEQYRPTYAEQLEQLQAKPISGPPGGGDPGMFYNDLMEYDEHYTVTPDEEKGLLGKVSGGLENILDLGAAAISPIGTLIKKGIDKIPESKSRIEYEGYSPTQQQAIDAAYGTGGVMEGYNPVSAIGEGVLATINERIANREANVSDPANDKTLQELKAFRNTILGEEGVVQPQGMEPPGGGDPEMFYKKPPSYNIADVTGDTPISGPPSGGDPEMFYKKPPSYNIADVTGDTPISGPPSGGDPEMFYRAANAPDAYTILGEEGPKQGVGPRYSDELNWRDQAKHTFGSPVQWEATDDLESDAATLEAVLAEERAAEERAANAPDRYTILGEEGIVQPQGVGPRYSDELNWRDQAKHTFGSPVQWDESDDLESDAGAAALETALGMKPSHTIADVSGPSTWRDDVAINVASDYPPGDTSDEAGGYEGSGPDYSGGVTTGTSFDADTDPADEGTKASYAGDVTQVGSGRQDREGGSSSSGGGGCVIATHAVDSGAFTPETKREAVRWCIKNLHRTWWGEAVRKGYRYYGQKAIEEGKAKNHYQEFKDYVAFGTGKKRTLKTAWTFVYRTIQFFIKGITIKDA
jgi:hypothetical protein